MQKKIKNIIQYSLFLGFGIFLIWWQLKSMTALEKQECKEAILHAHYWVMIPIIIMALLSHLSRALRWKILMKPLHYHPATKNVFATTLIGYLANAAVPRLGEVLRCTFLAKYENFKVEKLFGTIIIERIIDLVCFCVFVLFTILIQIDTVSAFVQNKFQSLKQNEGFPLWAKVLIFAGIVLGCLLMLQLLRKKYPKNKFIKKLNDFITGIIEGLASIKNLKQKNKFLLHTLFIWSMYLLQIYIGFYAMEGTAHLGFKAACSVLAFATLAMIITPGGLGTFPLFVMQTLGMYFIADAIGLSFGWLIWMVNTGIVVIAGLLSMVLLPMMNKHKNKPPTLLEGTT